jgi:hypothetical protein
LADYTDEYREGAGGSSTRRSPAKRLAPTVETPVRVTNLMPTEAEMLAVPLTRLKNLIDILDGVTSRTAGAARGVHHTEIRDGRVAGIAQGSPVLTAAHDAQGSPALTIAS